MLNKLEAKGVALHDVGPIDLSVEGGECVALAGPSGSGKSLTLRMIADLVPHAGECWLDGRPASAFSGPEWRQGVRYIPAETGWWAGTVVEHFADRRQIEALLPRVGLATGLLAVPPDQLSTGERQRMAFLRAVVDRPRVLLLDEPTSALDPQSTALVEAMVDAFRREGAAVVLVSHDAAQVERLASRVQPVRRVA